MFSYLRLPIIAFVFITLILPVEGLSDHRHRKAKPSIVNELLGQVDSQIVKEFREAWCLARSGLSAVEGLVLIFRLPDGSYRGELQGATNQYRAVTFKWRPDIAAIVHTHPKSTDPKPSRTDRRIADECGVPIFTITAKGMYVYDPVTKRTVKIMDELDWLDISRWTSEVYAKLKPE